MLSINFYPFLSLARIVCTLKNTLLKTSLLNMPVKTVTCQSNMARKIEPFPPRYFPRVSSGLKFFKNEHRAQLSTGMVSVGCYLVGRNVALNRVRFA